MGGKVEDTITKEEDPTKKKKKKKSQNWNDHLRRQNDAIELENSEGEKEIVIKWKDYEIDTLIAIHSEMEEEFAKSTRKQGMQ